MGFSLKLFLCVLFALAYPCHSEWIPGSILPNVGDANGWDQPEYYSTIQEITIACVNWLFARGADGLELYNYNHTTEQWSTFLTLGDFADSNNWGSDPKYYSTLQVIMLGDNFWLIGRNEDGLVLYEYDRFLGRWAPKQGNPTFSDANGWDAPEYYSTIQALPHAAKIWVFARGPDGEVIHQYDPETDSWSELPGLPALSDANNWGSDPRYYSTIQVVIQGDSFYLLGRGPNGIEVYEFNPGTNSWSEKQSLPDLSDENGWQVPEQYSTIQAEVLQDKIWLFARGEFGMEVFEYDPSSNDWTEKQPLSNLSDANGWDAPEYYSTIQTVPLNDNIALLARGEDGLEYFRYYPNTDSWTSLDTLTNLSDANNWDRVEYYSTILGTKFHDDDVTVLARGNTGMEVYDHVMSTE